jgi:UDP-glucose/GDP-mannose dehydrogenase family, UDP binding domain
MYADLGADLGPTLRRRFTVGYSPERINPGDKQHRFESIIKVVAGQDDKTLRIIADVYGSVVKAGIHCAPSIKVAEAAKVIENTATVLGITFKENVPDVRNSKAADIVSELQSFGIAVKVHDPLADPRQVKQEYGDFLIAEFGPVQSAGRERHASFGKIQERAAHELLSGDGNFVDFARLIEALDDEFAGRPQFEDRRQTIEREFRMRGSGRGLLLRRLMAPLLPASSAESIILPPSHATLARVTSPPATSLCSLPTVTVRPLMVSRQQDFK